MGSKHKKVILTICMMLLVIAFALAIRYSFIYMGESTDYDVTGVDVSLYQGDVNWKGLEREGYDFAFIKATEGSSLVDKNFERNWAKASATGMEISAYHFLSYDSSGGSQADNYIGNVKRKWGMLPPSVDVEFYGEYLEHYPSKEQMYEILDDFLEELESYYGMQPVIYTNKYIYEKYISGHYDDYRIWISDFDRNETLSDGREWTFCQYTFEGRSENVADGDKKVDLDVFNGSRWDLRILR